MADEEETDSKGRWKTLRSKLLPRRTSSEAEARKQEEENVSNFLAANKPSIHENRRPVGPKLDTSTISKWPKASQVLGLATLPVSEAEPEPEPFHYLKPTRRPGLKVVFLEQEGPDIIGFGGEDWEEPVIVISERLRETRSTTDHTRLNVPRSRSKSPLRTSTTRLEAFKQGLRYENGLEAHERVDERGLPLATPYWQTGESPQDSAKDYFHAYSEQSQAKEGFPKFYKVDSGQPSEEGKTSGAPKVEISLSPETERIPWVEASSKRVLKDISAGEGRAFLDANKTPDKSTRPGSSGSEASASSTGEHRIVRKRVGSGASSRSFTPSPKLDGQDESATRDPGSTQISRSPPQIPVNVLNQEQQLAVNGRLRSSSTTKDMLLPVREGSRQNSPRPQNIPGVQEVTNTRQRQQSDVRVAPPASISPSRVPNIIDASKSGQLSSAQQQQQERNGASREQPSSGTQKDLVVRCHLENLQIVAIDRTPFRSGSTTFLPPWHRLHVVNLADPDSRSLPSAKSATVIVFDDQGSFTDFAIRKQRFRLQSKKPNSLEIYSEPSDERKIKQRSGYNDPEVQKTLDHAGKIIKTQTTIQTYDFANLGDLHDFVSAVSGHEVKFDSPVDISIPRPRSVFSPNKNFQLFSGRVQLVESKQKRFRLNAFLDDGKSVSIELKAWDTFEAQETKGGVAAVKIVDAKFAMSTTDEFKASFLAVDMEDLADLHDDVIVAFKSEGLRDEFAMFLPGPLTQPKGFTLKRRI